MASDQQDKMRAGVLWVVMVCLSDGKVPPCSVRTILTVSKLSVVSVSCPSTVADSTELKYELLFNDSSIRQIHLNKKSDSAEILFSGQFEVTANNSGAFICKRERSYPPPHTEDCHTTEVIVAEEQSLPQINGTVPAANQSCSFRSPSIRETVMWAGCAVLLVYSLSITCIIIAIWRKMKRDEEDTHEYINTRPGECRKPGKA